MSTLRDPVLRPVSETARLVLPAAALLGLFVTLLIAGPAAGADDDAAKALAEYIEASYTKYETRIPMRDGVELFTAVYVPKDRSRTYGMMLLRTPYSIRPYGVDNFRSTLGPSEAFAREGFIFVYQDVRGRFLSQGEFVEMTPHVADKQGPGDIDESTDTFDTIEWMLEHVPAHNGKVGMWGISYPGFFTAAGMIDAHPALVAASPQAPVIDLYRGDDAYHNGALMLAANFGFFTFFEKHAEPRKPVTFEPFEYGTPDGYQFFLELGPLAEADARHFKGENPYWTATVEHTTYDDFWRTRSIARHIRNVPPAVLTVGGWFDAEDPIGPHLVFRAIEANDPQTANHLVMGPWAHGGWARGDGDRLGDVDFDVKTSEHFRDRIQFPFFDYHLNGKGEDDLPKAWVFETGTNQWRRHDAWPPAAAAPRALYFRAAGRLAFEPPDEAAAADAYLSDPARPVPFHDGISQRVPRAYMVGDQRFAAKRPDVLVYVTEPLDADVAIAGPITADLWVESTGTDADFVVKLIDVSPDDRPDPEPNPDGVRLGGYQQLVRGEPFRAKYRHSLETPEPLVAGEKAHIVFDLPDVAHVFRREHRIMVQVQSSWFPLVDRNPQSFVDIPNARREDFQPATHRLHRAAGAASSIVVRVLDRGLE